MKKLCVYDIEVAMDFFICCCKVVGEKPIVFEISSRRFELPQLLNFFSNNYIFVGYNSSGYDSPILNMLFQNISKIKGDYNIAHQLAFDLSKKIVSGEDPFIVYRYKNGLYEDLDLMTMMSSKALRVGLKSLQVTMCYHNVEEMLTDWNKPLGQDKFDQTISYCFNDIDSTSELLKLLKGDLQLRIAIQKDYKISALSKDGVGIGVDIFTKYICEELDLDDPRDLETYKDNLPLIKVKDFILPEIKFKTKPFQNVLNTFNDLVLDNTGLTLIKEWSVSAICNKLKHVFGLGGLHSANTPKVYIEDDEFVLIDCDVASMYPSIALAWEFGPKGFKDAFLNVLRRIRTERIIAKRAGDKTKDKTMKLSLNSILGHLRNQYGYYNAPEANTAICVNGQLFLAMLIEDLEEAGIEVIMSNTDGLTSKVHRSKIDEYYRICKAWEEVSKFELEYVEYEKMVIVAVNDYVSYKKGYSEVKDQIKFPKVTDWIEYNYAFLKADANALLVDKYIKAKGLFVPYLRLSKGLDSLIIAKSLIEYFGKGIPIKNTIENSESIWDFIQFQKVGRDFTVLWNEKEQQHINRFYVSKKGAYLYKVKDVEKYDKKTGKLEKLKSYQNVLKGYGVQLMNKYEELPTPNYNIQYNYYIHRANEIIRQLEPIQRDLFDII